MDALEELAEANQQAWRRRPRRRRRIFRKVFGLILLGAAGTWCWQHREQVAGLATRVRQSPEAARVNAFIESASEKRADEIFSSVSPAVVRVVVYDEHGDQDGFGSGFFVSSDGLLATNYHVIENAALARVINTDGAHLRVIGVVASNPEADLAILKVDVQNCAHLELRAEPQSPRIGQRVYAIGNPLGLTNTLSDGLISGVREVPQLTVIQTTAAISPGSSGGPLITGDGRVVGVTTAHLIDGQNLNFAVAANHVRALIDAKATPAPLPGAPR